MMQMLANPSSFAFSTSKPPEGVVVRGNSCKPADSCSCTVKDFECGCGARLGYYLESPCEECQEAKTMPKWFLCPRSVEAEPHQLDQRVTGEKPSLGFSELQEKPVSPPLVTFGILDVGF